PTSRNVKVLSDTPVSVGDASGGLAAYPTLKAKSPRDGPPVSKRSDPRSRATAASARALNVNVHRSPSFTSMSVLPPRARNTAGPPSTAWSIAVETWTRPFPEGTVDDPTVSPPKEIDVIRADTMSARVGGSVE